jgi:biotin synthase-like enzyme
MMPSAIKFDANAAPPQWTNGSDQTIEKGTQVRLKIKGLRGEISQIFAIATIKEVIPWPCSFCYIVSNSYSGLSRVRMVAQATVNLDANNHHSSPLPSI